MSLSSLLSGGPLTVAPEEVPEPALDVAPKEGESEQTAVLAGGCFWCVEAVLEPLEGVLEVTSGYAGGSAETADYRSVCSGRTDHAEVVRVRFDPRRITYGQILRVFFSIAHDPTQRDAQGPDVGRQYRSAIFYADPEQKRVAEAYIAELEAAGVFREPVATTLEPLEAFYEAEPYHQDYARQNPSQPYISFVATPKVKKLRRHFGDRLKRR